MGVKDEVTSPTYTIAAEYEGRLPLRHVDAYRLRSPVEFEEAGAELWLEADGVCLIEWSENIEAALPKDAVKVEFSVRGEQTRHIAIQGEALEGTPGFAEALNRLDLAREGRPA